MTWRTCSAISRTFIGSGPITRNCTGKPTGGPNTKRSTLSPRFRQGAIGKGFFEPGLDALAGLQVLGDDDDLSEIRVWQHRIQPKPKARRALADIGGVGDDVGIAGKEALGLLRGRVGNADRRAFREPHLKEQFGPGRGREELLLHQAETCDGGDEHENRGGDDGFAPAQGTFDQASQRAVDAGVVDRIGIVVSPVLGEIRQELERRDRA